MPAILQPVTLQSDSLIDLHALDPKRYPVLLESVAHGGALGGFDILLACPGEHLDSHGPKGTFLEDLDEWWRRERVAEESGLLPFTGGWFLFLGYELAAQIEPSLRMPMREDRIVARATRVPAAVVRRHQDGAAWIVCEPEKVDCLQLIAGDLSRRNGVSRNSFATVLSGPIVEDDPQVYLQMVERALAHIAAGDVYQVNLSRSWCAPLAVNVAADLVYRRLRRSNPAPFAGLAVLDDVAVVSSTPERLVAVRGGTVATRPIAGTRPRSSDRHDDAARLQELAAHPKERAEHIMLIDLERNDLGRICEAGSVVVDEFMTLESYQHVHHIVSNVRGKLRQGVTPGQVIRAVFPGGTITGCPKVRCMQIIAELESVPRGAYTGSMGYLNRDGSMDLNILIRTLEIRQGMVQFRAGAGIVADSSPRKELDETRAKARGLIRALE